jgi:DNA (cytosine-5)-methyltransferase 1
LPTPRSAAQRTSRTAATRFDSRSAPSLEQAVEIAGGRLPREFDSWDELPGSWQLLPTPMARDATGAHTPEQIANRATDSGGPPSNLNDRVVELLPTPRTTDYFGPGEHGDGGPDLRTVATDPGTDWGRYGAAIRRWERVMGPAPAPTEPNSRGNPRLACAFSEWMMGLPSGWVSGLDGVNHHQRMRCVGNAVVPHQAAAALCWLLDVLDGAR